MAKDMQDRVTNQSLTGQLGVEADPWVDLNRVDSDGEILMKHLAARYEQMTRGALGSYLETPEKTRLAVDVLVKQLSQVQADVFALKSVVLGRDEMVLSRDWDYRDPLRGQAALLGSSLEELSTELGEYYLLPNPSSLVGYGWHEVEEKDDLAWCWSGPQTESLLLVPLLFQAPVKITIDFNLIRSDVLPQEGALEVDHQAVAYTVIYKDEERKRGMIEARADFSQSNASNFGLKLKLDKTLSPRELSGKFDKRLLGLCLRHVIVNKQA